MIHWMPPDRTPSLTVFTIYDHPLDFPDHFVVRRWWNFDYEPNPIPDVVPRLAATLEEAHAYLPRGLVPLPPIRGLNVLEQDDPSLCEAWV